jgi:3-deoxy-D-manno-octulosonic-acid transferase
MKWVFAPHEVAPDNIERLMKLFTVKCVKFSEFSDSSADARVLIIDNIGMLSSAYRYAYIAAIGGGFGKGIHNILEAACWGIPILFGPNHKRFREAIDLLELESAKTFNDYSDFEKILNDWIFNKDLYLKAAEFSRQYVNKNTGATNKIVKEIE